MSNQAITLPVTMTGESIRLSWPGLLFKAYRRLTIHPELRVTRGATLLTVYGTFYRQSRLGC